IPVILPDLASFVSGQLASLAAPLGADTAALLAQAGSDDAPYPHLLAHLSTYMDTHWGDCVTPAPDGPGRSYGGRALFDRLAARAAQPVGRAVELGCSVGRGVAELCRGAELTVGIDLHFGALRLARQLLLGEPIAYARRVIGRYYQGA